MLKRHNAKRSETALFLTCFCLLLMGLATVGTVLCTSPEGCREYPQGGQRFVTVAEQKRRAAEGPGAVVLWKWGQDGIPLEQLTPGCDVHDSGCVISAIQAYPASGA